MGVDGLAAEAAARPGGVAKAMRWPVSRAAWAADSVGYCVGGGPGGVRMMRFGSIWLPRGGPDATL